MPFECTGPLDADERCEACQQSQIASEQIFQYIMSLAEKQDLSATQTVQAAVYAALGVAEASIASAEDAEEVGGFVVSIVADWIHRLANEFSNNLNKSQSGELNNVSNDVSLNALKRNHSKRTLN